MCDERVVFTELGKAADPVREESTLFTGRLIKTVLWIDVALNTAEDERNVADGEHIVGGEG